MTLNEEINSRDTQSFRDFLAEANRCAEEPLAEVLPWLQRKEAEMKARKAPMAYASDENAAVIREQLSLKVFGKATQEVNRAELHGFCVEVTRSLYINKRNCSPMFLQAVDLLLSHPAIDVVDQVNLLALLELFGLSPDRLNTGRSLVSVPQHFLRGYGDV